jgi:Protein of unknown function (DUF4238)
MLYLEASNLGVRIPPSAPIKSMVRSLHNREVMPRANDGLNRQEGRRIKSPNPPARHHYIPAFYLRQWAGADQFVCEMRKSPRLFSVTRKSPKATGFKRDLYKIAMLPLEQAQQFESGFLKLTDNGAYDALQRLIHDNQNWTPTLRSAWARFILSLLFRNPEAVATIRDHVLKMWEVALEGSREEYDAKAHAGETFEHYLARHAALPHIDAAEFLRSIIDDAKIGTDIMSMHWHVLALDKSDHLLMTSDRPVVMRGLGNPDAHIALPIGTRLLFLAARKPDFFSRLAAAASHQEIVGNINKSVVTQAREYVWAFSDTQIPFVRRYMSSVPDRVILSEAQKQQALDAIREKRFERESAPCVGPTND